jgi:hypothetical protein
MVDQLVQELKIRGLPADSEKLRCVAKDLLDALSWQIGKNLEIRDPNPFHDNIAPARPDEPAALKDLPRWIQAEHHHPLDSANNGHSDMEVITYNCTTDELDIRPLKDLLSNIGRTSFLAPKLISYQNKMPCFGS